MSAVAWATINTALLAWIRAGSGLDDAHVYIASQGRPRPASGAFVTLSRPRIRVIGLNDETVIVDNAGTIERHTQGPRLVTWKLTCYGPVGSTDAVDPAAILHDVLSYAGTQTQGDAFEAAGIGISDYGDVLSIDGVRNSTVLEPRAEVDVFGFVASDVVEIPDGDPLGTYIETAEITGVLDGDILPKLIVGAPTLIPIFPIGETQSGTFNLKVDRITLVDLSSGDAFATLPRAAGLAGRFVGVYCFGSDMNDVDVVPQPGDDGADITFGEGQVAIFASDGVSHWSRIL